MFLNARPKTEAECPPGTNIYDDSCQLEGSGFTTEDTVFNMCPPGSMMCDGVCVGVGAPTAERPDPYKCPEKKVTSTTSTISPMLILAAAAAAFFIGS